MLIHRKGAEQINTRERILEVTSKLIYKRGIHDTSLADICFTLKISRGTLYYYYKTKDKLITDVLDLHLKSSLSVIRAELEREIMPRGMNEVLDVVPNIFHNPSFSSNLHLHLLYEGYFGNKTIIKRFSIFFSELKKTLSDKLNEYLGDPEKSEKLAELSIQAGYGKAFLTAVSDLRSFMFDDLQLFTGNRKKKVKND